MRTAATLGFLVVLVLLTLFGVPAFSSRRGRRKRLHFAVFGAYVAGYQLATTIAHTLEVRVEDVYRALAELETRGWLVTDLQRPAPPDNHSPAPTAALPEWEQNLLDMAADARQIEWTNIEGDARRRQEGSDA